MECIDSKGNYIIELAVNRFNRTKEKLHNEELHVLYSPARGDKLEKKVRSEEYVVRTEEVKQ
jgi:hypothetical protein